MESSYGGVSAGYGDWRGGGATPPGLEGLRGGGLELGMSGLVPSSLDLDTLPAVLSFSPCAGYKDLVLKEKSPHDIADALLSLKHAVVHPQLSSPLSPLSPTPTLTQMSHLGHCQTGMAAGAPMAAQGYAAFSHHGSAMLHPNSYSSPPAQYASYPPDPCPSPPLGSQHGGPQPNMHFPAMSVNVSMSMNVGMAQGLGGSQYSSLSHHHPQQWPPQPPQTPPPLSQYHPSPYPQMQTPQYGSYSPKAHHSYGPSPAYSLSPDYRAVPDTRSFYYKAPEGFKDVARFCGIGALKRPKFSPERPQGMGMGGQAPETPSVKTNMCRICGKTYARPSTLKTHLRTHSGEKPYKCTTCNKSFSQAANLTAHIRTHSGEKPFRCPICDRRFSQSSSVTTHMRTHSGERPYRCRLCKKAFSDSSTLTKHLRIHSGEKPYQCKLCLLRFSQSGNLNRHMRVHASNN